MTPPTRVCSRGRGARAAVAAALGLGLGLGFCTATAAATVDDIASAIGGGVGVASAQTQRGISPSFGEPAVFGDVYLRSGGGWQLSLGAARWASKPGRASGEFTLALSRSWVLDDDWSFATTASHYGRLGGQPVRRVGYDEVSVSLSWQGRGQVLLALSPNTTTAIGSGGSARGRTATVELSWHERIAGRLSADAGIGHYDLSALGRPGYSYASAGLSYGIGPWLGSVAYVTNRGAPANAAPEVWRSRWLLSLWWSY